MSLNLSPSENLVSRAKEGDEAALEILLARHYDTVRQRIAPHIGPRHQALISGDDVMQQTGIDAFLRIRSMRAEDEDSFCGWLYRLAYNNLIDAIRMLDADKRAPDAHRVAWPDPQSTQSLVDTLFGVDSQTPSRVAAGRESEQRVQTALDRLPPAYREVVRLYDLQAVPIQEVATTLGRSPGAVHMLRARAHELLRRLLVVGEEKTVAPA